MGRWDGSEDGVQGVFKRLLSMLLLKTPWPPPSQGLAFSLLNVGLCWAPEVPLPIRSNQHCLCNSRWPPQTPEGPPAWYRQESGHRPRALPASLTRRGACLGAE